MARDYEAEDPVGYWENSANTYSDQVTAYTNQISAIDTQIEYAEAVKDGCTNLSENYDSAVDEELNSLGTAIAGALDEDAISTCVMDINSTNSENITNATTQCNALIDELTAEKCVLESKRDTATSGYNYSIRRINYYKSLGYE